MSERQEQLAERISEELRGMEDGAIRRIGNIWGEALKRAVQRVEALLDGIIRIEESGGPQPPGAGLGSTPEGVVEVDPTRKLAARLTLEGQLIQDLRAALASFPLRPSESARLDRILEALFSKAHDAGAAYAEEITRESVQPLLDRAGGGYQQGQAFTRLFDLAGSVAAAERDFQSLSARYAAERDAATDVATARAKGYFAKWWRDWGEAVVQETAARAAAGPDPRQLKRDLMKRIPSINEAFRNRAEVVARTETLIASGLAQDRAYKRLNVGLVRYMATVDDRVCEWCAPRAGCLYWLGSVRPPIHPQCRCQTAPVTLESLVLQNVLADDKSGTWENEFRVEALNTIGAFMRQNGPGARPRPVGGSQDPRGPDDYPLMEKTALPATRPRRSEPWMDVAAGEEAWPAGEPVWTPRHGWLDPNAEAAYAGLVEINRLPG